MLKRSLAILLVALAMLCFTGCGKDKTEVLSSYNYLTDCQIVKTSTQAVYYNIAKCENGYYSYAGKYLYFTDSGSMETIALCSKPNCLHDTDTCNAYIGATYNIAYNDGYIYYSQDGDIEHELLGTQFYRVKADGTEKEKLRYFDYRVMDWITHRGYLYYISVKYDVSYYEETNESNKADAYIYRLSLDDMNAKPEQVYFEEEFKEGVSLSGLVAFGDNLYFLSSGQYGESLDTFDMKGVKVNTKDFVSERTALDDGRLLAYPTLLGDGLVFQSEKNIEGKIEYYATDFNGNSPELILTVDEFIRAFSDGSYLYTDNELAFSIANPDYDKIEEVRRFKVYDKDMNLIDEVYFNGASACRWRFVPVDDEYFLFAGKKSNGDVTVSKLDKSQLGTIHGLWELEETYNQH